MSSEQSTTPIKCPDCGSEDIEEEGETFIDDICQDCDRVVGGGRLAE